MAEQDGTTNGNDQAVQGGGDLPQVGVVAQYVKDLSFENPNSPAVYQWKGQPQTDVQFNIGAMPVGQDLHEVTLKVDINSKGDEGVAFRIELVYAGLFALRNVPEEQMAPFLLAEAPRILFPFARQVVAESVLQGGFPPLMLDPIDFGALYMQQAAQVQAGASGGQFGDVTGQA